MHIKHIPVAKSESFQTKGKEKLIIKQENMNNMATVEVSNKVIEKDNTVLCMLSTAIIQSLMNRIDSLEHAMEDFRSKVNVNDFVSQVIDNVQNTITEKEMLNVTEAAEYLGISKSTIYKLTCSHTIPFYKPLGKTIYIDRKDLIDWMKTNQYKSQKQLQDDALRIITQNKREVSHIITRPLTASADDDSRLNRMRQLASDIRKKYSLK